MVTSQVRVTDDALVDNLASFGRVPETLKVMGSPLGSSAVTVMLTVVLIVKLTSEGPERILGGKLSKKAKVITLSGVIPQSCTYFLKGMLLAFCNTRYSLALNFHALSLTFVLFAYQNKYLRFWEMTNSWKKWLPCMVYMFQRVCLGLLKLYLYR